MNKLIILVIVVLVILVGAFFIFNDGEDDEISGQLEETQTDEDITEFSNLETSDDVFDEIDNTIGLIE